MRILGIDPGTQHTGYGIVTIEGGVLGHTCSGVISPRRNRPLHERLVYIFEGLTQIIRDHKPGAAAVEDVFFAKHPQGALKLGHARGVALLAAAQAGLEVHSYPPAKVKRALSGHGRADKEQIARLVTMLLKLKEKPKVDASDALSIAICHAARCR